MKAVELDTDMSGWPPGTKHFRMPDGSYVAVEYDTANTEKFDGYVDEVTQGAAHRYAPRPTAVIACDENGCATSLDRLYTFKPGVPHDEVMWAITPA